MELRFMKAWSKIFSRLRCLPCEFLSLLYFYNGLKVPQSALFGVCFSKNFPGEDPQTPYKPLAMGILFCNKSVCSLILHIYCTQIYMGLQRWVQWSKKGLKMRHLGCNFRQMSWWRTPRHPTSNLGILFST